MPSDQYDPPESFFDMRRRATAHFRAKADNARMCAFALWNRLEHDSVEWAESADYHGSLSIALEEGFRREAAIAIELILKAIICELTGKAPRATHDVYELWQEAELPRLDNDGMHRLALFSKILHWSGRYAAPRTDKQTEKYAKRFSRHQRTKPGSLKIVLPTPLGWPEFDDLYQQAAQKHVSLVSRGDDDE